MTHTQTESIQDVHTQGDPSIHFDPKLRMTFEALVRAQIRYVVLRGHLPIEELGKTVDIDVFMPRDELKRAIPVLRECGWHVRRWQTGRYPHVFFDDWTAGHSLVRSLDVVTEICFGEELLALRDSRLILNTRKVTDGVSTASPWVASYLFALHVALDKQQLSSASRARATAMQLACRSDPDGASQLRRDFGEFAVKTAHALFSLDAPDEAGGIESLLAVARQNRLSPLRLRRIKARALNFVRKRAREPVRVAFLGCDGSGKSTLVDVLCAAQSTLPVRSGYLGDNGFRTWPAIWLKRQLKKPTLNSTGIAFRVLANLYALWWPLEIAARMFVAERNGVLVLYDRFPFEQEIFAKDKTTAWGRVLQWYRATALRVLPSPDIVILLDGDPETIWRRKQEFSFDTHMRLRREYLDCIEQVKCERAIVPADRGIDVAIATVRDVFSRSASIAEKIYSRPVGDVPPVRRLEPE